MKKDYPNFTAFYTAWKKLKPGPKAELRRVSDPLGLLDIPAFYRLVVPFGWKVELPPWEKMRWQRLVFLLNNLTCEGEHSLGKALAKSGKVNEKRLFQIVRADEPSDIIQLRRVLKQIEPTVDWNKVARQIWNWDKYQKRSLMEDFVLNQKD